MKAIPAVLLACVLALTTRAQQAAADARINELERKLEQATRQIDQLKEESVSIESTNDVFDALKCGRILSFDYQFKNRPSFNDDAINGRLNLTWAIEF